MKHKPDRNRYRGREKRYSTFQAWMMACTDPTEKTYLRLLRDPNVGAGRATVWMLATTLVGTMIFTFLNTISGNPSSLLGVTELVRLSPLVQDLTGNAIFKEGISILITTILTLLIFLAHTGLIHLFARALGGHGTYSELLYAYAAFTSPFALVNYLLLAIPYVQCLAILIVFYTLYLSVLALKVVHRFQWAKAIGSFGILVVIWIICFCSIGSFLMSWFNQMFHVIGT